MRRALALALVVGLSWSAQAAAAAPPRGCHAGWPVVAHFAGGAPAATDQLPIACALDTGFATSESTIAVAGDGTLLYSPAQTENTLARSTDGGASWALTQPRTMQYTSLWNTVDPYVVADPRTGRVFWAHVTGPTRTTPVLVDESPLPGGVSTVIAAAYGFQVYSTPDAGRSWTTADYQTAPVTDWEKLAIGPPPAGGVKPKGYPNIVYLCGNSPMEASGPGRLCYRSLDGGATFEPAGYVTPSPQTPDACQVLASNAGVVGRDGTLYQPLTCGMGSYVAASNDEGSTYTWLPVPGAPGGYLTVGGGIQIAVDADDNLYALWSAGATLSLAISRDHGHSWSKPLAIAAPGAHQVTIPALAAGPRGHVGVAYYAGASADAPRLSAYITQTDDALAGRPVFVSAVMNDPAQPIYAHQSITEASPRADYVGAAYDAKGTLWAGMVRSLGDPDAENKIPTTGYVARLAPCERTIVIHPHGARGARISRIDVYVDGRRRQIIRGNPRSLRLLVGGRAGEAVQVRLVIRTSRGRLIDNRAYDPC